MGVTQKSDHLNLIGSFGKGERFAFHMHTEIFVKISSKSNVSKIHWNNKLEIFHNQKEAYIFLPIPTLNNNID